MKLTAAILLMMLQVWIAEGSPAAPVPNGALVASFVAARDLGARDLVRRTGRDCGKFIFKCKDAEGACNNACFHVNCVDSSTKTMVYDTSNSNDENRKQSGCNAGGRSTCNQMPFSQRFHDPLNSNAGDQTINCDEWPMATIKQTPFKEGTIRNSLRCIPRGENSSGGSKLRNFLLYRGNNPGKTCSGSIQDDDHWTVDFDTDDADPEKLEHCLHPQNCAPDPYEFHMTKLRNSVHFPLDVDRDNMYTITKNDAEIYQCSVIVKRQGDDGFHAEVYNEKNEQKGQADGGLRSNTDPLFGPLGSEVNFNYGAQDFSHYDKANDFAWGSFTKGSSKSFKEDGSYCEVGGIDGLHDTQSMKCYFPCGPK